MTVWVAVRGAPLPPAPSRFSTERGNTFERERNPGMIQLLTARMQLAKGEEGQALVEYALIVSLIAVVSIAALTLAGTSISDLFMKIGHDL
jgi:Flp pilus assembly pilin Flp